MSSVSPRKTTYRRLSLSAVALTAVLLPVLPQAGHLTAVSKTPLTHGSQTATTVVRAGDSAWSAVRA